MDANPEASVILTEKIKRWIRTALTTVNLEEDIRLKLKLYVTDPVKTEKKLDTIPFVLVKTVHECIQSQNGWFVI